MLAGEGADTSRANNYDSRDTLGLRTVEWIASVDKLVLLTCLKGRTRGCVSQCKSNCV